MYEKPNYPTSTRVEVVEAALCFLMSRYAAQPCYWVTCAIVHHLEILGEQPLEGITPLKRRLYAHLAPAWRSIASQHEVRVEPVKTPKFIFGEYRNTTH